MAKPQFRLTIEVDDNSGEILAAYIQVRKGKADEVREFANGLAFANYSKQGELLGIELLGPCELSVLDNISKSEPASAKRFINSSVPHQFLAAA